MSYPLIYMQESTRFMRLAEHLTVLRAWCKQCLPGRCRVDVYGRPVACQVILEPGIGQFREFEPRRVHTRINSWRFFLAHNLTCVNRESVS